MADWFFSLIPHSPNKMNAVISYRTFCNDRNILSSMLYNIAIKSERV